MENLDAVVVGGSFAGLSAALYLARARRSVLVIDAGEPRNRFANHSHGFFGHDGANPLEMIAKARHQVSHYPGIEFVQGRAIDAWKEDGIFTVALEDNSLFAAKRLLLASGISDILPKIPGLPERWGKSVLHCPYCHGYEFSDQELGVLRVSPASDHQALLISEWGPTTLFLNGGDPPDPTVMKQLNDRGVAIEPDGIEALTGQGADLSQVRLVGGSVKPLDALYVAPQHYLTSSLTEQLGCRIEAGASGPSVVVDEMKMTSVDGVFAAGDLTRAGGHTATFASSDGVMAGLAIHRSLIFGDIR